MHDRATAFHEAGHVVVTFALNNKVELASIRSEAVTFHDGRKGIADGSTHVQTWQKRKKFRVSKDRLIGVDRHTVVNDLAIYSAGLTASVKAAGMSDPNDADHAVIADLLQRVAVAAPRENTDQLLSDARILVNQLLDQRWSAVEAVAEALLRERSLSGAQIQEMLKAKRLD